jgi:hypothetical protein
MKKAIAVFLLFLAAVNLLLVVVGQYPPAAISSVVLFGGIGAWLLRRKN